MVDVLPGTTFDWEADRALFPLTGFDGAWPHPFALTPDDERFVMFRAAEGGAESAGLIVVRNFSAVLEARVPD